MALEREFEQERRWLILTRNFVVSRVEQATERKETVNDAVLKWVDKSGKLLDSIFDEIKESGDMYYTDMIEDMKEMSENRKFKPFSTRVRSSGPTIIRTKFVSRKKESSDELLKALEDYELYFNSTTLKQLSKELQDDGKNVIGLHGKRGSGKTTLAKAAGKTAKSLKIFDEVIFVTVSQNPNIRMIQDQIAKSLNLKSGRPAEIKSTLGRKNRILVILDDVPAKCDFDVEDMGIPCQRCKFLLTTRGEQGCSLKIGRRVTRCETMIPMGPLSENATWDLLEEYSGIEEHDGVYNVAVEVASACDGLPGTIIELGSSFRDKSYLEWTKLLDSLRHSTARYQIFLSLNGSDTRNNFTIPLYKELTKKGLKTFMDLKYRTEDPISAEVIRAIQDSRLSIIILSENFLGSARCLDELVHILKSKETNKQLVWPMLYKMEPKDISIDTKPVAKLLKRFQQDPEKIDQWKSALVQVSEIYRWRYEQWMNTTKVIKEMVDDVMEAKKYLYIQNIDMEYEEIEAVNADGKFEAESFQNIENSKIQSPRSRSNPPPEEGASDPILMALKEHHLTFNSETLEELAKELQNESINQIALHGKQGSGKTRLVEAVRDKAKSTFPTLFQVVLFARVSKNDTRSIQDQIASELDLKFEKESVFKRAQNIEKKIDEMKKPILVIFDDVPSDFDPEKIIGIPCEDGRCKFLLTARSRKIFPSVKSKEELRLRKTISMGPLSEKDALALLQEHSEIDDDDESSSKVLSVANEITKKYKWWPGEIVEIGSSLKGKPLEEWQGLLDSLRHSDARYQIFLSFRGKDSRAEFTSTLYAELRKNGFTTFMDKELKQGDEISTELVKAIKDSRLSIVVLSVNYPNSSWCLDELVHILECMKTKKQLVWPVFYKVEPTEIRYQTGLCEGVMTQLEKRYPDKIATWKKALHQVCSFSGRPYKTGDYQPDFIQGLVDDAKKNKNYLYIRNLEMLRQNVNLSHNK